MPLIELTTAAHRQLVHQLRTEAETWLAGKGLDQYQPATPGAASYRAHQDITAAFDRGDFLGLQLAGDLVAVGTLTTTADPAFWSPAELADPHGYVGRLMVIEHGRGYGAAMLAAIVTRETRRGARWLRLDCWRSNDQLHAYYRRQGFTQLDTRTAPGRMSGARFQRDLRQAVTSPVVELVDQPMPPI